MPLLLELPLYLLIWIFCTTLEVEIKSKVLYFFMYMSSDLIQCRTPYSQDMITINIGNEPNSPIVFASDPCMSVAKLTFREVSLGYAAAC